jgi:hypothetical protein
MSAFALDLGNCLLDHALCGAVPIRIHFHALPEQKRPKVVLLVLCVQWTIDVDECDVAMFSRHECYGLRGQSYKGIGQMIYVWFECDGVQYDLIFAGISHGPCECQYIIPKRFFAKIGSGAFGRTGENGCSSQTIGIVFGTLRPYRYVVGCCVGKGAIKMPCQQNFESSFEIYPWRES